MTEYPAVETATEPIRSPADLRQRWRALMGPLGFGERLLRFVLVGPDRCFLKVLSDVECAADFDVPVEPFFRANDEAVVAVAA
ncbi:MAG: hypothetical protein HZB45_04005 [Mycolicibacterium rufum]|uniref:Uncharacterized protein n=1 Tax=Mycolicibacterium chlorophenolicum TaxID=37916 RepID=A0A0J6W7Y7_9MYCO|nr:hypothetical protein [Mycolicibacterium chlorophenolicum]KMO77973.1 hypothetical protein MCHLDSM_01884 [Mycolicibacterium chlorophenolicum]MBI5336830.1 hypothetical protein [Mycolicibacterium rufum]